MPAWIVLFVSRLGIYLKRMAAGQPASPPMTKTRQEANVQS
jgi:hypothetical protein